MYERMLDKQVVPTIEEMTAFCGENAERFSLLNEWLTSDFNTEKKVVFPYGNNYGWGVSHTGIPVVMEGGFITVLHAGSIWTT